jgi:hypothetical protein
MKVKHVDLHFVNLVLMIKIFTSTTLLGEHKNGTRSICELVEILSKSHYITDQVSFFILFVTLESD